MQISFAVTAKLIKAFVFATWIVQFLIFLNPKFQSCSHLLLMYILICVGPGRKSRIPVFSKTRLICFFSSSCHAMLYCSKVCQKTDWSRKGKEEPHSHKKWCSRMKQYMQKTEMLRELPFTYAHGLLFYMVLYLSQVTRKSAFRVSD